MIPPLALQQGHRGWHFLYLVTGKMHNWSHARSLTRAAPYRRAGHSREALAQERALRASSPSHGEWPAVEWRQQHAVSRLAMLITHSRRASLREVSRETHSKLHKRRINTPANSSASQYGCCREWFIIRKSRYELNLRLAYMQAVPSPAIGRLKTRSYFGYWRIPARWPDTGICLFWKRVHLYINWFNYHLFIFKGKCVINTTSKKYKARDVEEVGDHVDLTGAGMPFTAWLRLHCRGQHIVACAAYPR